MIFLNEQLFQNPHKFQVLIEDEKKYLNYTIESQQTLKEILLHYVQEFGNSTNYVNFDNVNDILKLLSDLQNSLMFCNDNIFSLEKILNDFSDICNSTNPHTESLDKFNQNYSEVRLSVMKNTMQIEDCIYSISCYSKFQFSETTQDCQSTNKTPLPESEVASTTNSNTQYVENTLIISEISGKVVLPYTVSSLEEILQKYPEKYSNIDEIIDKDYTLPIDLFKVPSVSRFRETFKLVRNKEKQSIKSAFELGMELLFNYNLHPAIIAACKSLDELDIYLDYLESGETNKFDLFKIIFEIAPKIV